MSAIVLGALPLGRNATAAPQDYDVGCENNVQGGFAQAATGLTGSAPSSGSVGQALTVTGLQVTAALPAALIQAGVGLSILHDGQVINGTISVSIAAAGATPANVDLSGPGSGTVHAPNRVAQPLSIVTNLPNTQWTPTAAGTMTLALGKTGDLHNDGVTSTNGASPITDGSVLMGAAVFSANPDIFLVCKPGTVSGTDFTAASSTAPFASIPVGSSATTTTVQAATTTTTHAGTTTTTTGTGPTTTTAPTTSTTVGTPVSTTLPPRTSPAITLDKTFNFASGDPAAVTGTGFDPFATIGIEQCGPKFAVTSTQDECDVIHAVVVTTDASGAFSTTFHVLETGAAPPFNFSPADKSAVCPPTALPSSCVIAAINQADPTQKAMKPISFNIASPAATTATPAATTTTAPVAVLGTSTTNGALAFTGSTRTLLILVGAGLLLVDLGYLTESATRPSRRAIWLRRSEGG